MTSHFSLLVKLTEQMYQDIKFVAENNPTQVVDDESTRMFNAVLSHMRAARPQQAILAMFSDMNPRTLKYKDALVVTGQLRTLAQALDTTPKDYDALITSAQTAQAAQPKQDKATPSKAVAAEKQPETRRTPPPVPEEQNNEEESLVDEELYGTRSLRINEEGIVPFDLSDS